MTVLNKNISFGTFNTKEEAEKSYVTGKKNYILKLADSCKGKVQDCLYNAMVNWNVELMCPIFLRFLWVYNIVLGT